MLWKMCPDCLALELQWRKRQDGDDVDHIIQVQSWAVAVPLHTKTEAVFAVSSKEDHVHYTKILTEYKSA